MLNGDVFNSRSGTRHTMNGSYALAKGKIVSLERSLQS